MAIDPQKLKTDGLNPSPAVDLGKELQEQKEILLKIYEQMCKTKRYIMIGRIISLVYLLLIVVPIILAVIYLPPLINNMVEPYQQLMGQTNNLKGVDMNRINDLINQFSR